MEEFDKTLQTKIEQETTDRSAENATDVEETLDAATLPSPSASAELDDVNANDTVTPQPSTAPSSTVRPMQKVRFLTGLVLAGGGIGMMLTVAMGALHNAGADGRLSLPVVAICMVIGLMLLGGGFGIMATAAPGFDDDEFERLMRQGNPVVAENSTDAESFASPRVWKDDARPVRDKMRESVEQSLA